MVTRAEFDPRLGKVAQLMVENSLRVASGDRLLVVYNPGARQFAKEVNHLAQDKRASVLMQEEDPQEDAKFLTGLGKDPIPVRMRNTVWANKFAMIRCIDSSISPRDKPDPKIEASFRQGSAKIAEIRAQKARIMTTLPTPLEAKADGIAYEDYLNLYFEACTQPWGEVEHIQDILINEILNPGKQLILQSGKTRLIMSIEGQTFANSAIYRNIPGSEVFTGPVRGTLEGRLDLPYPIRFAGRILPRLALEFKQGKVWDFQTEDADNRKWVEGILDAGAREVGEVALGTNPVLNRPFLNTLFIEKVSGSFHLALGKSYTDTIYAGRKVKVDNGVRSEKDYHIDLTCVMLPEYGGEVIVDGKTIQQNGIFTDPRLAILNPR